jgi:glyoxylase-like metal-dependent hydrolase (beta-lactamase superfamily II)
LFGDREKSYRRGVPTVPAAFRRIAEGEAIEIGGREWRVFIVEGHAPELACLYCAELGVLISADQVLPSISPDISVHPHEPAGDPLALYLASLARLRAAVAPETLVLPSLPFFGLHQRIDALAVHHQQRCEELITALDRPKSAVELLPVLFRRPLDQHQTAFALGEILAHLHYLERSGPLERARYA